MRCTKTVTPLKLEANRKNAKRSTGPRTERGKSIARFNAVTRGLFAKHVIIPICDGDQAGKEFQSLLDGLHQDFQPVGFYEEWLVIKIAQCMWRLRRATRCESGSIREAAIWGDRSTWTRDDCTQLSQKSQTEIWVLHDAEKQLKHSGTLSQKTYEQVAPLVEEERRKRIQSEKRAETDFDRDEFLTCITDRKESLKSFVSGLDHIQGKRSDARFDYNSLLPEDDMDRILRYEERMQRDIDWAIQRLLERQERRNTLLLGREGVPHD